MHLRAGLLALVFVASWSLKTLHGLCMHHAHHGAPVCEAAHEGGNTQHLHDERYTPDDCSVCAFMFAVPEIVGMPLLPGAPAEARTTLPAAPVEPLLPVYANDIRLRGPPAPFRA